MASTIKYYHQSQQVQKRLSVMLVNRFGNLHQASLAYSNNKSKTILYQLLCSDRTNLSINSLVNICRILDISIDTALYGKSRPKFFYEPNITYNNLLRDFEKLPTGKKPYLMSLYSVKIYCLKKNKTKGFTLNTMFDFSSLLKKSIPYLITG